MTSSSPTLAVTLGDPAGIGPEVVAAALATGTFERVNTRIIGPKKALLRAFARLGIDPPQGLETVETAPGVPVPSPGGATAEGGRHALTALAHAAALARAGKADAIVTAPLSKEGVRLAGEAHFVGHTEYLAEHLGAPRVRMMMACPRLRVVLATTHLPLREVPKRIDTDTVLDTIRLTHEALRRYEGIAAPRIAVCGLNPHPGEFGREDGEAVAPAVERARKMGIAADGPRSADALFARVVREQSHDAVVAMYHDQGLGPFKLLGFEEGVNITLGLPVVRTSPDHGTAYALAGTGTADPTSFRRAVETAIRWVAAARAPGTAAEAPRS